MTLMIDNGDDLIKKKNDMNARVERKNPKARRHFVSGGGGAGMMKSRSNYLWAGWSVPPSSKGG